MIVNEFADRGEPDMLYTIVKVNNRYVLAGVEAQELFKGVLGEKEWNRRCAEAYRKDTGQPLEEPLEIEVIEPVSKRYFAASEGA
jgi:hypothetical protein